MRELSTEESVNLSETVSQNEIIENLETVNEELETSYQNRRLSKNNVIEIQKGEEEDAEETITTDSGEESSKDIVEISKEIEDGNDEEIELKETKLNNRRESERVLLHIASQHKDEFDDEEEEMQESGIEWPANEISEDGEILEDINLRNRKLAEKLKKRREVIQKRLQMGVSSKFKIIESQQSTEIRKKFLSFLNVFESKDTLRKELGITSLETEELDLEEAREEAAQEEIIIQEKVVDRVALYYKAEQLNKKILGEKSTIKLNQNLEAYYEKQLQSYNNVRNQLLSERKQKMETLAPLITKNNELQETARKAFKNLQDREYEVGSKYVVAASQHIDIDKIVKHLLRQQAHKLHDLKPIRLKNILLRAKLETLNNKIKIYHNIGGFTLLDYELLQKHNKTNRDKLDIQQHSMSNIRKKIFRMQHVDAHVLESIKVLSGDIKTQQEILVQTNQKFKERKCALISLMERKSNLRKKIAAEKERGGLLNYPKLVKDLLKTQQETDRLQKEIDSITKEYAEKHQTLEYFKSHIKEYEWRQNERVQ